MNRRIIGLVAAAVVLAISIFLKVNSQQETNIDKYYMVNLIIVSAAVTIALALSLIVAQVSKRKATARDADEAQLPNRRDHYRIAYDALQRPLLRIEAPSLELTGENEFQVLDISEQGLCFLNDQNVHFGNTVQGELEFADGETVPIEGHIVRETGAQLSLKLASPIPFKAVIKEQRRIIADKRYKNGFKEPSAFKGETKTDD